MEQIDQFINLINQTIDGVRAWADGIIAAVQSYMANPIEFGEFYTFVVRWIFPVLAVLIFARCAVPMLRGGGSNRIWGFLEVKNAYRIPIMHWENSIGRSKLSDIVINLPFISRSHAVLSLGETGWTITDLGSKGGISVNGEKIEKSGNVKIGDMISFATAEFQFIPSEEGIETLRQETSLGRILTSRIGDIHSGRTFLLVLAFQLLGGIQMWLARGGDVIWNEKAAGVRMLF
ncbi:MAG TPA: FHA domain-containing protein, partial [Bacillota bacterium]|nr:FHA domain-containing protein [Bacillota bacterium]